MNKKVKQLWLEALRSGKYQQGRTVLRHDDQYCCLGVLCDLHAKAFNRDWGISSQSWSYNYSSYTYSNYSSHTYCGSKLLLPQPVAEWAGIDYPTQHQLSNLNDTSDSFERAAQLIEANL